MRYSTAQDFNRRITIKELTDGTDSWGQPIQQWVAVCSMNASVLTQTGMGYVNNEMTTGGTEVSRTTVSFRIHKPRRRIVAGMRVYMDDEPYDIRVVLPDHQNNRYMDLGCAVGARG
jgi:SPP1 family predicted phage head-tail adaptor